MHEVEKPSSSPLLDHHDIILSFDASYDDNPYVRPIHLWIEACCEDNSPYKKNMNKFLYADNLMFHFRSKQRMVIAYEFLMNKVSLFWLVTKLKGRKHKVNHA